MLCLNKIPSPRKLIFPFIFAVTFFFGIWASGYLNCYKFRFYTQRTFTENEANTLVGKKVFDNCANNKLQEGKVVGYRSFGNDNEIFIQVFYAELREKLARPEIDYSYTGSKECLQIIE